jgi:serine/threonine kinase PknH
MEPLTRDDPGEIAGYRIRARLGAGGMGRVYLGFTQGGRPVAVKSVRPELADDPDFRLRFRQEVAAARRVGGLYTAQVLDADPDAMPPWLVTAYVPGPSLQQAVAEHGPMPADTVLLLMAGVAEALQAIHAAGVVHRDLKPSNVLLAADGPRVIDFGIARAIEATSVTRTGVRVGSPQFMAPEQIAGDAVTPAIDIFALGALAAYAATARPPFGEGTQAILMYRVMHEAPNLDGCLPPLRSLIEQCLAKQPAQRPAPGGIVAACRGYASGGNLEIAQSWLPPAVAAGLTQHAPPPVWGAMPAGPGPAYWSPQPGPPAAAAPGAPQPGIPAPGFRTAGLPPPGMSPYSPEVTGQPPAPPAAAWGTYPGGFAGGGRPRRRGRTGAVLGAAAAGVLALVVGGGLLAWHAIASRRQPAPEPSIAPQGLGQQSPAVTSPTTLPGTASALWYTGTWVGSADQPFGRVTHWTARLTFPANGKNGTFAFPSLGCSGTLVVTVAGTSTLLANERVTSNPRGLCAAGGVLALVQTGPATMSLAWQDASDKNNVAAGHLTRQ